MHGATPAITELLAAGVPFTERAYAHDPRASSYGWEAAEALGRDADQVFKTLMVTGHHRSRDYAIGIVPVSTTLDLKKMAKAMTAKKLTLAPVAEAERISGYVAGGISPLGQRRHLPTIIDASAKEWATILVSGGRRGLDIELSPLDLAELIGARFAPITER